MTGVGKSEAIKADEATRAHLEAYAHTLEMKLAKKKALLNEATKLHDSLAARLFRLEEGLSLKDVQLESLTRQNEEVRVREFVGLNGGATGLSCFFFFHGCSVAWCRARQVGNPCPR